MRITLRTAAGIGCLVLGLGVGARGADDAPAAIKPPAPNRVDEPLAEQFSLPKAAEFLDAASVTWTNQRKCGTCHTNYPYLMVRPLLGDAPALREVRRFFEDRMAGWESDDPKKKPRWDMEVVATASALAFHDAHTTGRLHPLTRRALDTMWTLQRADGSWNWLKCNWPPSEDDDYYGVLVAALGVGVAPDGYADTPAARTGMAKVRAYLKAHRPPHLHHQAMLLWASTLLPDRRPAAEQRSTVKELLALQRDDGGWSLPSLGNWQGFDRRPNDKHAPSDAYATGLIVYVLRRADQSADDPAIRRGVAWLRTNQRQSGRWFTRSLNTDRYHFISHAGTAYAVLALHACGVK